MCLARKKWSHFIIRLSPLKWLGVLEATIGRWSKHRQNLFLENFPPQKSNVISFCTYNQCNGGTQPNLTFSAVFISILLAFAGSHLWQKHICWKIHFVEIIYRTRIWYLLNLDTKVPQSIQASVYTLPPLPPPQTAMPNWMDHFSKRGFPKVFEQKTFFVKRWSQWWVWDDHTVGC